MPSRRKRKRRRQLAEATAQTPKTRGGWGQGVPTTLSDLVWLRRAIRERWPVAPHVRQAVVDELEADLTSTYESDSPSDFGRAALSRVLCIIEMEGVNQEIDLAERAVHNGHVAPRGVPMPTAQECGTAAGRSPRRPWAV